MRGMTERDKKLRLLYGAAFLVLMVVETLIALYVHAVSYTHLTLPTKA